MPQLSSMHAASFVVVIAASRYVPGAKASVGNVRSRRGVDMHPLVQHIIPQLNLLMHVGWGGRRTSSEELGIE